MIDKLSTWNYLKVKLSPLTGACLIACLGWLLLGPAADQALAGAVQDGNAGRAGQTLDLRSLPVQGKTTLVDVYSPYCPPCMMLAPLMERLAQKRPDLAVKKVSIQRPEVSGHIDWQSPLAKQLDLHSIPHFMIFDPTGRLKVEGTEASQQVRQWLEQAGLLKE